MIALAIAVVSLAAYLLTGWKLAVRSLPRFWEKARDVWSRDDSIRCSVKWRVVCMVLFWPFVLPILAISRGLNAAIDAGDPEVLQERIRDRDRRIADLERQLNLNLGGD